MCELAPVSRNNVENEAASRRSILGYFDKSIPIPCFGAILRYRCHLSQVYLQVDVVRDFSAEATAAAAAAAAASDEAAPVTPPALSYPPTYAITPQRFCALFPYHVIFDRRMRISQVGGDFFS